MTDDDKKKMLDNISFNDKVGSLKDVDFAIEAANEDFVLKARIFEDLAKTIPSHAILATNTSSISITKLAGTIP